MIKIIPHDAWPHLRDEASLETVKVAATGFRGHDFGDFVKRASHPLALWVRENPPLPGEIYTHKIALYSTEIGGQNRNSDAYGRQMLERDHPSFVKHARVYRNHRNTDPAKSYGIVKQSIYNPQLGRVELITALNATKEAAERNGGLTADTILNKLASNIDVAVSQACRVSGDYCLSCDHFARNRGEYCGPENCKYGGCRDNLGRVFDDGFHLGVDNRDCRFFDISDVSDTRGADRCAFITGKVASSERIIGGAELAEQLGLTVPDYLLDPQTLGAVVALRKLASVSCYPHAPSPSWETCIAVREKRASGFVRPLPTPTDDHARHQLLADLAADGVVLPPARWLSLTTGASLDKCAAVFQGGIAPQQLLDNRDLHEHLAATKYADSRLSPPGAYAWLAPTLAAQAEESSRAVLTGPTKFAAIAVPTHVRDIACHRYLAYQAGVLASHQHRANFAVLVNECTRHNTGLTI